MIKVFGDHKEEFFLFTCSIHLEVSWRPFYQVPRAAVALSLRAALASIPPSGAFLQASVRGWTALRCPKGIVGLSRTSSLWEPQESPGVIPQSIPRKWHVNLTLHHASETPGANALLALGSVAVDGQTESLLGKCTE